MSRAAQNSNQHSYWRNLEAELESGGRSRLLKGGRVLQDSNAAATPLDILISDDGVIAAIEERIDPPSNVKVIDIPGTLVVPSFVDAHQHLDKTGVNAPNPSGTLQGAIDAFAAFARTVTADDIRARAVRTIGRCRAHGTGAIRSHVNVDRDTGLTGFEVLTDVRAAFGDDIRLQLVAFMTSQLSRDLQWLEANIDAVAGRADVLGASPSHAENPTRQLDIIFEAAVRHGRPVDLHLDEHLDVNRLLFDEVIDRTEKYGLQGQVVLGHACVLSALPLADFNRICDRILKNDIGVVTLPAANLYLQGRAAETLPPRGLTRVADFLRAGVTIAAASDNIQDPFIPTGSGDLLEIARWTFLASQLPAQAFHTAFSMISDAPAKLMGLDVGLRPRSRADLVITDCDDLASLISAGPLRRIAMVRGRPVTASSRSSN
jgi:cytosine/creatinine deaminase